VVVVLFVCACSNEVFSVYKFREIVPGCCPHPGDIVESGSLAVRGAYDLNIRLLKQFSVAMIGGCNPLYSLC